MRLIDADELVEDLQHDVDLDARALDSTDFCENRRTIQFDKDCKQYCIVLLLNAPTVDSVKHGHFKAWWHGIDNPMTYTCSVCGFHNNADTFYCPHCGAKMDEEE